MESAVAAELQEQEERAQKRLLERQQRLQQKRREAEERKQRAIEQAKAELEEKIAAEAEQVRMLARVKRSGFCHYLPSCLQSRNSFPRCSCFATEGRGSRMRRTATLSQ